MVGNLNLELEMASPEGQRQLSIFEVPRNFFDSCRLLSISSTKPVTTPDSPQAAYEDNSGNHAVAVVADRRWTCNTCKAEFESLLDQRTHFKSDIHRINVKLTIAGKEIVNEEDFDDLTSDSLRDYDISSISGSEDEDDNGSYSSTNAHNELTVSAKQRLFFCLQTGKKISLWRCLLLNDCEGVSYEAEKNVESVENGGTMQCVRENEVIERLRFLIHEPRNSTHLIIVLLAGGGHFAGCVFDGNSVVVHKTFHRYVVRAKAGKKQSSKDAGGKAAHSAGASLRRHNELALKKDIQELLNTWKPYFDASCCIFIHAPSSNRQLFYAGDKAYFSNQGCVRNVPFNIRRPTFKEARRVYWQLTKVVSEVNEKENSHVSEEPSSLSMSSTACSNLYSSSDHGEIIKSSTICEKKVEVLKLCNNESDVVGTLTPLHLAVQNGDSHKVLELLELGMDPCVRDERGRTPYMVATEKEVRNTFRRFMASNIDKWDWNAAKVPSALTKEMEESQAAKQAEKDAKRKVRAKELKKLRKAREKKAQVEVALSQNAAAVPENLAALSLNSKGKSQVNESGRVSNEVELRRVQAIEREKRAAAAERRMAAAALKSPQGTGTSSSLQNVPKVGLATDIKCYLCEASLSGKVPFHRYNYKYCSTSCMNVHREILEDG